jgi:hypothetical protein
MRVDKYLYDNKNKGFQMKALRDHTESSTDNRIKA